jgi:hypothetical protein
MRRYLIVAAVMLVPSVAMADWAGNFKTLDADGNGRISRVEYEKNVSKLNLDPAPTFTLAVEYPGAAWAAAMPISVRPAKAPISLSVFIIAPISACDASHFKTVSSVWRLWADI